MTMLIESFRGFVHPWQTDHVGHANLRFYTARFDEATLALLCPSRIDAGFLERQHSWHARARTAHYLDRRGRAGAYPVK